LKRRNCGEETVVGGDFGLEVRDDMWVPHGSERERGSWYRFGKWFSRPWAGFLSGPKGFPEVQFHIFIFFSSFSFSVFLFLL
jgi:hypothetical protein